MKNVKILWADDEIDHLKLHILFLEGKGHIVTTANNGDDAIELAKKQNFDIIFLDENMPGLSGLETLSQIKSQYPSIPVVMITKSEEEDIMDEAIGSKIADYLIKPVNPKQILLTIKKNVDTKRLITQKTTLAYQTEFNKLGLMINETSTIEGWKQVYKKLVYWELELERSNDKTMDEILKYQKEEANNSYIRFIKKNYLSWFNNHDTPLLSTNIIKEKVLPLLNENNQVFFIVIDNFRYDQWKTVQPIIREYYELDEDNLYTGILPTATQFARNAIFAGMTPYEISIKYPELWLNDDEEGAKNQYEEKLLELQLAENNIDTEFYFEKIFNNKNGKKIVENLANILQYKFVVLVYNFIDMLSHSRTEMEMIKELSKDESAYRSLTQTWFEHSALLDLMKKLSEKKVKIVLTTDHGTIRVDNPIKVLGDKSITKNLRYKQGKRLNYKQKQVFEVTNPKLAGLPASHLSSRYIFAQNKDFFAYPNNYNYYVKYYKDTFQHGGMSLEEMLLPIITLSSKST